MKLQEVIRLFGAAQYRAGRAEGGDNDFSETIENELADIYLRWISMYEEGADPDNAVIEYMRSVNFKPEVKKMAMRALGLEMTLPEALEKAKIYVEISQQQGLTTKQMLELEEARDIIMAKLPEAG